MNNNISNTYKKMKIKQSNVFYNYTLGFDLINIDLVNTSKKLLKLGVCKFVFLSDYKCLYINDSGQIKFEIIIPEGRKNDIEWAIDFQNIPIESHHDLNYSYQMVYHERKISSEKVNYLRTFLPAIVLEDKSKQIVIYPSVKIYSDGIVVLSFQLDENWDNGIKEECFLNDTINIVNRYFSNIWIDHRIQLLDAEIVLERAFEDNFSIAGKNIESRKNKKFKKVTFEKIIKSFQKEGKKFVFSNDSWILHKITDSEKDKNLESSLDLCRSIYSNAIKKIIIPPKKSKKFSNEYVWQGRPSVSLLRFDEQPDNKRELVKYFSNSINKMIMRTNISKKLRKLPPDHRMFNDYCFHGSRSLLLWTWLKSKNSPDNAWDDPMTYFKIFSNQASAEQIEYYNMTLVRASYWAHNPLTEKHLIYAYRKLSSFEQSILYCSASKEISDSISYFINIYGTQDLVLPAKDAAKFYIDQLRYKSDKLKKRSNDWMTFVFGIVGAASFADFIVSPIIQKLFPTFTEMITHLLSFGFSVILIFSVIILIYFFSGNNK